MSTNPTLAAISAKLNTLNKTYLNSIGNSFMGSSQYLRPSFDCASGDTVCQFDPSTQHMNILFGLTGQLGSSTINDMRVPLSGTNSAGISLPQHQGVYVFDPAITKYTTSAAISPETFVYSNPPNADTDSVNFTNPQSHNPITTDINCMDLLLGGSISTQTINGAVQQARGITYIPQSFFCLQALYAWYSLLDNSTWQMFNGGVTVTFNVPDIVIGSATTSIGFTQVKLTMFKGQPMAGVPPLATATSISGPSANNTGFTQLNSQILTNNASIPYTTDILGLMNWIMPLKNGTNGVFDQDNFNPFVARRLVHLYIMMFQYNIALSYYSSASAINPSPVSSLNGTPALISAIYNLLQVSNTNVTDLNNGTFTNIVQSLKQRANKYNDDQTQITSLNTQLVGLQNTITKDKNTLSSTLHYETTIKNYNYATISIFLIVAFAILTLYFGSFPYNIKIAVSAGLIVIAIITSFVIQYYLTNTLQTEGFFAGPSTQMTLLGSGNGVGGTFSSSGQAQPVSSSQLLSAYSFNQFLPAVSVYIDNTLLLTTTLDNYHLYGTVNVSMDNQYGYYNDSVSTLTVKDKSLKDVNNIRYIKQVRYAATINLFITITFIVSIGSLCYFALESYPTLGNYIIYLCLTLIVFALILYVLEISTRVHTHPKQLYWAANTSQLNGN
jgi:hypothetical protein